MKECVLCNKEFLSRKEISLVDRSYGNYILFIN